MAKNLKTFLRYTNDGKVVPGGNISSRAKPKIGRWEEMVTNICCTTTTTTTEYIPEGAIVTRNGEFIVMTTLDKFILTVNGFEEI